MREIAIGVGEWTVGMSIIVAGVVGVALLCKSYYIVALMFLGHMFGFVLCRRAVFPWVISPYRFYASLMYKNAVSFVPPSVVMELAGTFVILYAYYIGLYSVLARLYVYLNCNNKKTNTDHLKPWVMKGATLSLMLTMVAKSLDVLKSFLAYGPIADFEYADDILTGMMVAILMTLVVSLVLVRKYKAQVLKAACP